MKIHIVKQGDTLYNLSKKYNVSLDELIKMNPHIKNPDVLHIGDKVKIPTTTHAVMPKKEEKKEVVKEIAKEMAEEKVQIVKEKLEPIKEFVKDTVSPAQKVFHKEPEKEKMQTHESWSDSQDLFKPYHVPALPVQSFYDMPKVPGLDEADTWSMPVSQYPGLDQTMEDNMANQSSDSSYSPWTNVPPFPDSFDPQMVGGMMHPNPGMVGGMMHPNPGMVGGMMHPNPGMVGGMMNPNPGMVGGMVNPNPGMVGGMMHPNPGMVGGMVHPNPGMVGGMMHPNPGMVGGMVNPNPGMVGGMMQDPYHDCGCQHRTDEATDEEGEGEPEKQNDLNETRSVTSKKKTANASKAKKTVKKKAVKKDASKDSIFDSDDKGESIPWINM